MYINIAQGIALVQAAVNFKGRDHIQDQCVYADFTITPNQAVPGCIVGTALFFAGVTLDTLGECEGIIRIEDDGLGYGATEKLADRGVTLSPATKRLFNLAQSLQDGRIYDARATVGTDALDYLNDGHKLSWGESAELAISLA